MQLNALIVDDEPLARDLLRSLLTAHDGVAVIGECSDGDEAIEAIRAKKPDMIFLDVQMPEMDGFDVIEEIGAGNLPPTVFVTAFQEHAVRAFDVQAIDYLTKPVESQRLERALQRVREKLESKSAFFDSGSNTDASQQRAVSDRTTGVRSTVSCSGQR